MRCRAEHQRANLDRADAAFQVQLRRQRHAGKLVQRNVRQEGARVDIDGVPAGRLHDGHAVLGDVVAQIGGGGDAVAQVVLVQRFLQAHGDGLQVAAGQAAVGGKALGQDQQVLLLPASTASLVQRKPPMLAMPSFLADMVQPSPSANISCAICLGVLAA